LVGGRNLPLWRFRTDNRRFGDDPILWVGMITMAFALTLAAVALTIVLRNEPERAVVVEAAAKSPVESRVRSYAPWRGARGRGG
jgi:hypothetical protein